MSKGCDVSQWQDKIDWDQLAGEISFAFIRSNHGVTVDEQFARNWAESKRVGVARGPYLYYHQSMDGAAQARVMIEAVGDDWGHLPPVVDVEDGAAVWTSAQIADLHWCLEILEKFSGLTPILYTRASYWNPYIGNPEWASHYGLWVAYWSYDSSINPVIPKSWLNWDYYQYSNKGSLAGVSGKVDLDTDELTEPVVVEHPTPTFTSDVSEVVAGGSAVLEWNAPEASGIYFDGGGVTGPKNHVTVNPTKTTTYTLQVDYDDALTQLLYLTITVTEVVVTPTASVGPLGIAVIWNRDAALQAIAYGFKAFSVAGNYQLASQIQDLVPDAVVMVRPQILNSGLPNVDYLMSQLGGCADPRLIYSGLNESDQIGQDPENIIKRGKLDVAMAAAVRAKGARYAAFSHSVGCPDWTNQKVIDAVRAAYADGFNAGDFGIDGHYYSPYWTHINNVDDAKWYETRWQFFMQAGLDLTKSFLACSECGSDKGSEGGFVAQKCTGQDVQAWARAYIKRQKEVGQPGPILNAIFAIGDPVGWAGYDMTSYLGALQDCSFGLK